MVGGGGTLGIARGHAAAFHSNTPFCPAQARECLILQGLTHIVKHVSLFANVAKPRPPMSTNRFPFPRYPNGWFQVAYSDDLAAGGVLPLEYFGKQLVLFRGQDGKPYLLDAY